jgi:N utilization substance protein B
LTGQSPAAARRRSRQLALQGLYEWAVGRADPAVVEAHMREQPEHGRCDAEHFDALLRGCIEQVAALDALLARYVDRPLAMLSPVELATLRIGAFELKSCIEIPYRVVINEAVELAKAFGGTDGHKFVNGVLDKAAAELRPDETRDRPPRPPGGRGGKGGNGGKPARGAAGPNAPT